VDILYFVGEWQTICTFVENGGTLCSLVFGANALCFDGNGSYSALWRRMAETLDFEGVWQTLCALGKHDFATLQQRMANALWGRGRGIQLYLTHA
jgi:hypothetical protein